MAKLNDHGEADESTPAPRADDLIAFTEDQLAELTREDVEMYKGYRPRSAR